MRQALAALAALAALGSFVMTQSAAAAISDSEELTRIPEIGTGPGSGAGQLDRPFGLASDPVTGHLFVTENSNSRVSEFTPWGSFVKAFGYDVAPSAVNEQQEVRLRATDGQFKLSFNGATTPDLPFNATATQIEAALNALSSIGGAGGSVSVESVASANGKTPYVHVITFRDSLAATNVEDELKAADGTTPLSGGIPPTESLVVRTRADGTVGGVGLESCTEESGCKAGISGSGPGQLGDPRGVTVDGAGNLYVKERSTLRVQKFDAAGRFVLTFGGKVNKTTNANLCTAASLDVCGVGVVGEGPGEFGSGLTSGVLLCPPGLLLCGPSGALFAADVKRIQRFSLGGIVDVEGLTTIPGETVEGLAFDPVGEDFYATYTDKGGVHELEPSTGAETLPVRKGEGSIATSRDGELFTASLGKVVLEYDPAGSPLVPPSCCGAEPQPPPNEDLLFGITALGTNGAGDLHVANVADADSFIRVFGPPPLNFEGPPPVPPTIVAQFASSVQRDGATVAALINPHFFTDTHYRVQYGTGACSAGSCTEEAPIPPALLTTKASGSALRSAGIFLEGLTPGITYHYRFVAESSGGGPVLGAEATFTTADPLAQSACANDVFRGGASARLPDCRAYEMVSPVDKNNGDIKTLVDLIGYDTKLGQSSEDGNGLTYSSSRSFGDPKGAPLTNQYLARRIWSSDAIDPAQGPGADVNANGDAVGNPYKVFSPDLCTGWFVVAAEPLIDPPRDFLNYPNVYRRDLCGGTPDEALLPVQPTVPVKPNNPKERFTPELQGVSSDGQAAIVRVRDRLTKDAPVICVTNFSAKETVSYQWLRNGAPIVGATASGYVPGDADKGTAIQCQVTTHKGPSGSIQVANPPIGSLLAPASPPVAPSSIPAPTPSEPLNVGGPGGQTLNCDPNEAGWSEPPSFSYQWYRNGTAIGGASLSTYVLTAPDLASPAIFQCAVTATNADGSVVKVSANEYTNPKPNAPDDPPVANASTPTPWQTYYASNGELHFLCIRPDGSPNGGNCSGGTGMENATEFGPAELNRKSNVAGAISDDGKRVYWTDSGSKESGTGRIYLRINPGEEESALGCEAEKACTVAVSGSDPARFLAASPDGARALFEVTAGGFAGTLFLFDTETGNSTPIAGELVGLAATSEDLSRVYFVSKGALAPKASAGKPNLYLDEAGTKSFIATLSQADIAASEIPSNTSPMPIYHAARASADGGELAFISTAGLTDYDNADLTTGTPDSEVYLYEAGAEKPVCISCNPSGARPQGRLVKGNGAVSTKLAAAGWLPTPDNMLYTPRALSKDGERLFFESFDALLPRDVNAAKDVYEWESAASKETCAQMGAELYVAAAGGCLSLISSGESPEDSEFLDASANASDVFFVTNASLLPQDPGLYDVYDARVGGGLPLPPPPVECQGETCKPPATAPNDPSPASSAYVGPGNLKQKAKKKKAHKKHHKGKKKGKKGKKKKGGQKGRAGR